MLNVQTLNDALSTAGLSTVTSIDGLRVECMTSPNGNQVPNQYELSIDDDVNRFRVFQSYETIIAVRTQGKVILDKGALDYSNTTSKYLKIFLGTSDAKKILLKRIESGEFLTADLNK